MTDPIPSPAQFEPPLPQDLSGVLAADPVAQAEWDKLRADQKKDWVQYLSEGREPARRAIRLANLLMSITDE